MGKLSEYFRFLEVSPSKLNEFKKKEMCYIGVTDEMMRQRRELKLYDKESKNDEHTEGEGKVEERKGRES